jgi:predicted  nucleic acid-binding Zn-ribbon protein
MLIIPPYREGHYWARCKKCGEIYEELDGESKRTCAKCRK